MGNFVVFQSHLCRRFYLAADFLGLRRGGLSSQVINQGQDFLKQVSRHGNLGQAKGIVKLSVGKLSGVGGDPGTVKFQLQATVKIDPKSVPFRFTHRVCHLSRPINASSY